MNLKIITPEREVVSQEVDQVTVPTADGEITVLPHHVPLVGILKAGEIRAKKDGAEIPLAVSGGWVQVRTGGVTILADTAERVEEIILERAEEAHARAQELLSEKHMDQEEYALIAAKMEKELARIKAARKYRHRAQ